MKRKKKQIRDIKNIETKNSVVKILKQLTNSWQAHQVKKQCRCTQPTLNIKKSDITNNLNASKTAYYNIF